MSWRRGNVIECGNADRVLVQAKSVDSKALFEFGQRNAGKEIFYIDFPSLIIAVIYSDKLCF